MINKGIMRQFLAATAGKEINKLFIDLIAYRIIIRFYFNQCREWRHIPIFRDKFFVKITSIFSLWLKRKRIVVFPNHVIMFFTYVTY